MVNVLITTDSRYPVNRKVVRKAVLDTFARHEIEESNAEISIVIVGERKMKDLSTKYLGDDQKHEILTFAIEEIDAKVGSGFIKSPDGILRLGDVVLCWPQVLQTASNDDVLVNDKVYALVCHGVEHLLGENHE